MEFEGKSKMNGGIDYTKHLDIDYTLFGLHKEEIFDDKGDLIELNLYRQYDDVNEIYSEIAIKEERNYIRNSSTGLLKKRITDIKWYDEDGNVILEKTQVTKFYSKKKGFRANKRARKNLIEKASMYLFGALITADPLNAEANVDNFESLTDSAASKYIKSNTQPLIDIITNSTDNTKDEFRDYMTTGMRDTLLTILNVSYV